MRYLDWVLSLQRFVESVDQSGQILGVYGLISTGQPSANAFGRGKEKVDEVSAWIESSVTNGAQKIFRPVGRVDHAIKTQHARRSLDGVGISEERCHELSGLRMVLQLQEPIAQRGKPVLDLLSEGRYQLRVVGPAAHAFTSPSAVRTCASSWSVVLNWAMEARRSPAREFSSVAAAAACLDPTAYCRDTSAT